MQHMPPPGQLGFAELLTDAETGNRQRRFDRATAHLPGDMAEAIRFHRRQIKEHHAAIQAGDLITASTISAEAHLMAVKVNKGDRGILASDDAPGYVLARRCAAVPGKVPLFGQDGRFTIEVAGIPILIELSGMFGLGGPLPGFAARAVERAQRFISETGYRSFLGNHISPVPLRMTTADFAERIVAAHIAGEMKGRLVPIRPIAIRPAIRDNAA